MKILWLLVLLFAITSSATQERKRRLCGLLIKKVCGPTQCKMVGDIANHAYSEKVDAEWIKEKCCPPS